MWFYLTAVDPHNQIRKFSFHVNQLEQGFDILNRVVARGERLTMVQLIDEQTVTALPVEAFDGGSAVELVKGLESEWQAILEQPTVDKATNRATRLALAIRRLAVCETTIARIDPMVDRTEALLLRSHKMYMSFRNQVLEKTYQRTLSFYLDQLDRAYFTRLDLLQTIDNLN